MRFNYLVLISLVVFFLSACGEEPAPPDAVAPAAQTATEDAAPQTAKAKSEGKSTGGVSVKILPENPTSTGCLQAVVQGVPGRSGVIWHVNGAVVSSGTETGLCNDFYQRDDLVTVQVGTNDQGATASVTIGNSKPRVVNISSTPDEIYAGTDVSVTPVAEDIDGDQVDFTYQWLINDEAEPTLNESVLPGDKFTKGDSIKVQIVPNDFYEDGPVYESFAMQIPNSAPQITSIPPQGITSLDYLYQVEVSDPDDTEFTFRLDEAPDGMSIDASTGLIKWSLVGVNPGEYTIAIIVADSEGAESAQEYKLTLGEPQ